MVELETGSPVRSPQECLDSASKICEAVTHEEKHRDDRSDIIDVRQENASLRNRHRQEEGAKRLPRL